MNYVKRYSPIYWDDGNGHGSTEMADVDDGNYVLFEDYERAVAELTDKMYELERLCDATYVQQGADAYNYACALIEQLQGERIANGREPGTQGSLCDGLAWAYGELMKAEDEITRLRDEVEGLRKTVGEVTQCLSDTVNDVGGWAVEEVIESGMSAAMGADA